MDQPLDNLEDLTPREMLVPVFCLLSYADTGVIRFPS
jgi:hypothetical protein